LKDNGQALEQKYCIIIIIKYYYCVQVLYIIELLGTLCGLYGQNGPRVPDGGVDDKSKRVAEQAEVHDSGVTKQADEVVDDEVSDKLEHADHHVTHSQHQLTRTCTNIYTIRIYRNNNA